MEDPATRPRNIKTNIKTFNLVFPRAKSFSVPRILSKLFVIRELLEVLKMMLSMAGSSVKVKIKANTIPTDIIFPNSMTGLMSPNIKERKAMAVVNAAKKHGLSI